MISGNDETIAGEKKQHFASFATQSDLICTRSEEACVLQLLPVPLRMQQLLEKKNRAKHTELQTPPLLTPTHVKTASVIAFHLNKKNCCVLFFF